MYKGNNPTALQSQKMITDTLLSLMEGKSFAKITIKELCEKALISRQTFYTLFQTKESVLELYFDNLFSDYSRYFETSDNITIADICNSAIIYLIDRQDFIRLLVENNLNFIMTDKFKQYLLELGDIIHAPQLPNPDYAMSFVAGALVEMIAHYLKDNARIEPSELSAMVEQILTGQYFKV